MSDEELAALLSCRGLRLPKHLRGTARKRLRARLAELGLRSLVDYRAYLDSHAEEWSVFDAMCRVTISRFHRDSSVFDALVPLLRPGTRVWSAGCASGEEPYTIAIMQPRAQILATDADERVLDRARRGCYPPGCLRELPAHLRERAFVREGAEYCLRDEYRHTVTFRREDLRATMPDGPFDIILCRNLAFTYFDEATQKRIAAELIARLTADGVLVIGKDETLPEGVALEERAPSVFGSFSHSHRVRADDFRALVEATRGLPEAVTLERKFLGGVERLTLKRELPDGSMRYLQVSAVGTQNGLPPGTYSVLGGSYRNRNPNDNFDGRTYGSLLYVVQIVQLWLVELSSWAELPRELR